jgi:hypothetical protein
VVTLKNEFVGTWKLKSYEVRWASDKVTYPFGEKPEGRLTYSENGFVSVNIMATKRRNFEARELKMGTPEEKVAAAETYISYSGRYDIEGDKINHHVEVCLFPNWVGKDQVRIFDLNEDTLALKTIPDPRDEQGRQGYLIWERIK